MAEALTIGGIIFAVLIVGGILQALDAYHNEVEPSEKRRRHSSSRKA